MAWPPPSSNPEYNCPSYSLPPYLLFRVLNWTKFYPSACCGHKKNRGLLITTWGLGAASHKLQYLPVYSCSFNGLQIALNKFLGCRRSCAGLFSLAWTLSRGRGREKRKRIGDSGASFLCSPPFILPSSSPAHNLPLHAGTGQSRCQNLLLIPKILLVQTAHPH